MNRPFRCPNCYAPLIEEEREWHCEHNHHFDKSKQGYVNLILANQGRHKEEGDSKESILARKRFLSKDYYSCLRDALIEEIASFNLTNHDVFADIACGEGYYTGAIAKAFPLLSCLGIDISKPAIIESAKERKAQHIENLTYAIGNMDYLPLLDGSIAVLLNCFAPIAEKEFARVLREGGYYVRVLPADKHLLEFKEALYPEVRLNIEKEKDLEGFTFLKERRVEMRISVPSVDLLDLFTMTPYAYKTKEGQEEELRKLNRLDLQVAFLIRIYQKN